MINQIRALQGITDVKNETNFAIVDQSVAIRASSHWERDSLYIVIDILTGRYNLLLNFSS